MNPSPDQAQRPDFSGIWKLKLDQSKLVVPMPLRAMLKIDHQDPRLVDISVFNYSDGTTVRDIFEMTTSGEKFFNFVRGERVTSRAEWHGSELLIESWLKLGERDLHFRDHWFLSQSGDTLTMQHRDDDLAGQVAVFARSADSLPEFDVASSSSSEQN